MAKKAWLWFTLLLVASLILAGCTTTQQVQHPPLRVEWTDWDGDYTLLVAKEMGFFEKYGVEVEPVYYASFSKATPDIASRKLDGGLFGIQDMLTATSVTEVKTVAVYDSGGTVAVVSSSTVSGVADLKGKKVGAMLGSYGDLFVRQMLRTAGLTIKDIEMVNLDPSQVPAALSSGSIAAGYVWAPLDQQAVSEGHKILYTQTAATLSPDVIVFSADVVDERPDDVRAFLNAWFDAVAYRESNPEESQKILVSATGKSLSEVARNPDLKLYTREDNLQFFAQDAARTDTIYDLAQLSLDFKITRGDITFPPNLNEILDPAFLQPAAVGQAQ